MLKFNFIGLPKNVDHINIKLRNTMWFKCTIFSKLVRKLKSVLN